MLQMQTIESKVKHRQSLITEIVPYKQTALLFRFQSNMADTTTRDDKHGLQSLPTYYDITQLIKEQ